METSSVNTRKHESGTPPASETGVGLLKKALQILDLFDEERPAWTQSELVAETALARSTLSRLVRFLAARGYLIEQRGRYTLGFAAIDLGRRASLQFDLVELSADLLEELAQAVKETVILTRYDESRGQVVCVAQIPGRQGGLRVFEDIGTAHLLHCGASAKAVLAFLPERRIEMVLDGPLTPVNPAVVQTANKLKRELAKILKDGFAVTHEETYVGVTGISVPVLTPRGQVLGSIAVAGPRVRINDKAIDTCARALLDVSRRLTKRIGGTDGQS